MSRWVEPPVEKAKPKAKRKQRGRPYARRTWRGHLLDNRTISAIEWAEKRFLAERHGRAAFRIGQGIADGSMSGGTHLGGGAVDIMFAGVNAADRAGTVKWLRRAGFAAWAREGAIWGTNNDHAHAVLLGHDTAHPSAKAQMASYLNHRDGLANNAWDSTPRPRIPRRWNHRLGRPVIHPLPGQKLTPAQKKLLPPKPRPPR